MIAFTRSKLQEKNKMQLKYVILCIFLSLGIASQAQPGYQGKKLLVLYDYRFIPTLGNNFNYHSKQGILPDDFSVAHEFSLEYVVSRKRSLGFRYSYSRSTVNLNLIDGDDSQFDIYANLEDKPFKSHVYGFGLYSKNFFGGHANLAPRGIYVSYHADAYYSVLKDSYINNTTMSTSWSNFSLGMGIGKQLIAFNRVIIDYGFESNVCLPGLEKLSPLRDRSQDTDNTTLSEVNSEVNARTFSMYMFMFKLGIGFLAH